jgi:hypothetical protein
MRENKGRIDVQAGQRFLADHYDTYEKKVGPDERTLCVPSMSRRADRNPGSHPTDAALAGRMSLTASLGHSCIIHFKAAAQLKKHPEFAWQQD